MMNNHILEDILAYFGLVLLIFIEFMLILIACKLIF
jgi:hypothetical protein